MKKVPVKTSPPPFYFKKDGVLPPRRLPFWSICRFLPPSLDWQAAQQLAWDHTDQTRCPLRFMMWFLHCLVLYPIEDTCFSCEASKVSVTRMGSVGSSYPPPPFREPDLTARHWLSCFLFRLPWPCPTTACKAGMKCSSGRCVPSPSPPFSLVCSRVLRRKLGIDWTKSASDNTRGRGREGGGVGGMMCRLCGVTKQMKTKGKSKGTVSQQARECSLGGYTVAPTFLIHCMLIRSVPDHMF